jgi:hypothetical protein
VFHKESTSEVVSEKPRNVVIQWDAPRVTYTREVRDGGVVRADPDEYTAKFGSTLKTVNELPDFVREIRPPTGLTLASESVTQGGVTQVRQELEGDVYALSFVDLNREGLGELSRFVEQQRKNADFRDSQTDTGHQQRHTEQHQQQQRYGTDFSTNTSGFQSGFNRVAI